MLKNMKLATKLLLGFISVAIIAGIIGFVGYKGMNLVKQAQDDMALNYIPSLDVIHKIAYFQSEIKSQEVGLLNRRYSLEFRRHFTEKSVKLINDLELLQKKFDSLPKQEEDKVIWKSYLTDYDIWKKNHEDFFKLANERTSLMQQGVTNNEDERLKQLDAKIFEFYNNDVRAVFNKCEQELLKITDMQLKDTHTADVEADKAANNATLLLIIFIIGGMALAVCLGIFINRNVQNQLGGDPLFVMDITNKVAAGDLSIKLDINGKNETSLLFKIDIMIKAIKSLVNDSVNLSEAAIAGKLDKRADASKHQGDYKAIIDGINETLDAIILPLNMTAEYVDRISKGDLPPIISNDYKGDFNEIKTNMNNLINTLKNRESDVSSLINAAINGNLDKRADTSKYLGSHKASIDGVNKLIDSLVTPLNMAAEYIDRISKGDIPPKITDDYKGDFNEIKNNLNQCIDSINLLVEETQMLSKAALYGRLDTRADSNKHNGDFKKIIEGINNTLSAIVGCLEAVPNPIQFMDTKFNIQYINEFGAKILGKTKKELQNGNTACSSVWSTTKCSTKECPCHITMDLDKVYTCENDCNLGSKHYDIFCAGAPLHDENGNIIGSFEFITDLSDIKNSMRKIEKIAEYQDIETKKLIEGLKQLANGDFTAKVDFKIPDEDTKSAFNILMEIKDGINIFINAVITLRDDAQMLAKSASDGILNIRADENRHNGDFRDIISGVNKTLDNVIGPLNVAAEYINRISKGDIPKKITIVDEKTNVFKGDFIKIKDNLNQCIDAIDLLVTDAIMLANSAEQGKLDIRADAMKHGGKYKTIITGVNNTLDNVIGPLNVAAEYVDRISKGDIPPKIIDEYKGDFNEIKNNLNQCIDSLNSLVNSMIDNTKHQKLGDIEAYADITKYEGVYKELITGYNEGMEIHINNILMILNLLKDYSDGNLQNEMPILPGKQIIVTTTVNKLRQNILNLINDTAMLTKAAIAEKFEVRADAFKHEGDFRKIAEGINQTLDVVVNKIFWYEQLLDAIPNPVSVTDLDMNWTFINKAAEGVAGKTRKEILGNQCSNWGADICGTEKCGVHGLRKGRPTSFFTQPGLDMDFKVESAYILNTNGEKIGHIEVVNDITEITRKANYNKVEIDRVSYNLKLISEGNFNLDLNANESNIYTFSEKENFQKIYKDFEIAKDSIMAMVNDTIMLSNAAEEGKLDIRADLNKHNGEFKKIIAGVNKTLDNVIGPLNMAAEYMDRIAKGDIPPKITDEYKGDFNEIKNNLNQCIDAINLLLSDATLLVKATLDGKLDARANENKHGGEFKAIIEGVNKTLDNVIGPLNMAAEYVDRISKGDIPPKITDEYKGDFNEIKNNLNGCVDAVNALVNDALGLVKATEQGLLSTRVDASKHQGNFREIIEGVNKTLNNVIEPINEAGKVLEIMATGSFVSRMQGDYKGDNQNLKNSINALGRSLSDVIAMINDNVQTTASSAFEISSTAESLAAASQEQSAQTEEVASAVEEMSRTVSENAMSANRTADVARKSGDIASIGAGVVKQTVNKMKDIADVVQTSANNIQKLGDSSKEIGEIISVIDDIADQTNLLALNAAIEAARAGEQGRGFAVVADEVRKLAERTTEATKQIAKMIKGIQKETDQAVLAMNKGTIEVQNGIDLADKAGESLNHILTSTQDVLDMINQIAAASEEQSATSEQISKNVMSISKVTGESAQRIEDVARTSDELAKLTEQLRNLMAEFTVEENESFSYSPTKQLNKTDRKHLKA